MSSAVTTKSAAASAARKSSSLPPETVEYLKAWMMSPEHVAHPYPTEQEKAQIMAETGIELKQLTNWFVNNRKRYWKPRVEAKLQKFTGGGSPPAPAAPPAQLQGTGGLMGTGGLSIAVHNMHPVAAKPLSRHNSVTSFPTLPNNAEMFSSSSSQSASPTLGDRTKFGPAGVGVGGAAAAVAAMFREQCGSEDPHTISDGSASASACNSDDDSVLSGQGRPVQSRRVSTGGETLAIPGSSVPVHGGYRRHEEVDVHVLRPETSSYSNVCEPDPLPCLRDLTIKASIPKERILTTFKCPISYTIPYEIEHDRKKVQSRRDGEVLRVKKHYLKLYLAMRGIHSVSSPVGGGGGDVSPPSASGFDSSASSISSATEVSASATTTVLVQAVSPMSNTAAPVQASSSRSRAFAETDMGQDPASSPLTTPSRKRPRTASGSFLEGDAEWRMLCQTASSLYCESLPGLEEAARMFGYVSPVSP